MDIDMKPTIYEDSGLEDLIRNKYDQSILSSIEDNILIDQLIKNNTAFNLNITAVNSDINEIESKDEEISEEESNFNSDDQAIIDKLLSYETIYDSESNISYRVRTFDELKDDIT